MKSIFTASPERLEQKVEQWVALSSPYLQLDFETAYSGRRVYALTITNATIPAQDKIPVYIGQPHAHEPATISAMVEVIEQLLTGKTLASQPTELDVQRILSKFILTFNPMGNPDGRARSPLDYFDGTQITNEQFWCVMRGEDPTQKGRMWGRYNIFDTRDPALQVPDPIGIVYEQVDEYRYVEPNRHELSSFFRLFRRMDSRYNYRYWLDLHQTEFVNSEAKCCILLPLPAEEERKTDSINQAWAERITEIWEEHGFKTLAPKPLSYRGEQADYLRRVWSELDGRICRITTEVKNNSLSTPYPQQVLAQVLSIVGTFDWLQENHHLHNV